MSEPNSVKNLYVIVLAWNHWDDTRACVESLLQTSPAAAQIVVVDNGSSDGTSALVRANFPSVEVITLEKNVGLVRGYNSPRPAEFTAPPTGFERPGNPGSNH